MLGIHMYCMYLQNDYNLVLLGPNKGRKHQRAAEHPSVFPIRHQRWWRGARSIFLASVAHQLTQTCSVTLSWSRISLSLWFRRGLCRWVDKHPTSSLRPHMHLVGFCGPRIIRSAPWLVMENPTHASCPDKEKILSLVVPSNIMFIK